MNGAVIVQNREFRSSGFGAVIPRDHDKRVNHVTMQSKLFIAAVIIVALNFERSQRMSTCVCVCMCLPVTKYKSPLRITRFHHTASE